MPKKESKQRHQRNLILVEWTAAVYGIFWSVWWGFFAQSILGSTPDAIPINSYKIPKGCVLFLSTFLVCFYAFHFVRWMWGLHKLDPGTPALEWVAAGKGVVISIAPIIGMVITSTHFFDLPDAQQYYGISLTMGWPLLTALQVWFSEDEVFQP